MSHSKKISKSDITVIKWLANICRRQIPAIALLIVLNIAAGVMSIFFANFSKRIIDGATEYNDFNIVIKYTIAFLGIVILQMTISIIKNCYAERCKGRLDIILKSYLFKIIVKKDYSKTSSYHTGDLQNRIFNAFN